jgi:hypothetical protein
MPTPLSALLESARVQKQPESTPALWKNPAMKVTTAVPLLLLVLVLVFGSGTGRAADIYRWVDEQGRNHMGDTVPERYRNNATRVDSRQFDILEKDRQAALQRAASERERLAALEAQRKAAEAATLAAIPSTAASAASVAPTAAKDAECDGLWRAYFASQGCFAPYQTRFGVRPEAFAVCKDLPSPSQKCGPAKFIPE